MQRDWPIGIFDSGIGGLTVFEKIQRLLPSESLIYFGDTAHVPYGNKSSEAITRYALEITDFLVDQRVKMIVCACNTASSIAIDQLRQKTDIPIIEVITPTTEAAIKHGGRIGIIGTKSTIASKAYLAQLGQNALSLACPLFVPLVEEGWIGNQIAHSIAHEYLAPLKGKIDSLILGCTHYPLLSPTISKVLGPDVTLIDSGSATAKKVFIELESKGLLREGIGQQEFWVSDDPQSFEQMKERLFPCLPSPPVRKYSQSTQYAPYPGV